MSSGAENSGASILVVEDDEDSLTTLTIMLEKLGYQVCGFTSPTEALDKMQTLSVDIAFLDIMMPGMDGYQLMEAIKQLPQHKELPVIFVTAKADDNDVLQGYQGGADYYVTKPYTKEQIEYALNIFLS